MEIKGGILGNKIEIIAEIGQNFCGDMTLAYSLIEQAKSNGANYAKFQLFDSFELYGEEKKTELNFPQAELLFVFGKTIGIEVFFSVFDIERVKWCEEIGVKRYKIAARNWDKSLWSAIEATRKPTIISVDNDNYDKWGWSEDWQSLYCISKYPAHLGDLRFDAGLFEGTGDGPDLSEWEYPATHNGFSDHTIGLDASKIAMSRGAKIIEKHFAIDHETGVDAEWSMTPDELKELRRFADSVEECL